MSEFCQQTFRIIGTTPQDIPFGKLAKYMVELSSLIGHEDDLRFDSVKQGSVAITFNLPEEQAKDSTALILEAANGMANAASATWRKINSLLKKDKLTAEMLLVGGKKIQFTGEDSPPHISLRSIVQKTSIQGRLIRIEGGGDSVKIGLEIDGNLKTGQIALNAIRAAELAKHFHKNIRLDGEGKWGRDNDGNWYLESLNVVSFEMLQDCSLKETLKNLKTIIPHEGAKVLAQSINEMRQS